jgi:glycosyltransferase involved in cell wall biosynthesis
VWAQFASEDVFVLENETTSLTEAATQLLEHEEYVVAHVQGNRQLRALQALKARHANRFKIVFTVHSFGNATWRRRPYSWRMLRELRKSVDYTLFLSSAAINEFCGSGKLLRGGHAGLMPLANEDWSGWRARQPEPGQLDAHMLSVLENPAAFTFIFLAAFKPGKGHRWLVESLAPTLRKHPSIHIILAGWGDDRIRRAVLRATQAAGVEKQIVLPGSIGRELVPWVLARCEAGIVPSISETFAQCIVEPMAAGLPVVSTRKGVGQWLIMDYHTGLGVEYGDGPGLARAVEYFATHREAAAQMGRNAKKIVQMIFDWDDVAACHLRLYASLLPRTRLGTGE